MNPGLFYTPVEAGDADANLYITAVEANNGTLSENDKTRIQTLFSDLKAAEVYNKIKILYLYHGNHENSCGLNAINPTGLLGAYKIIWTGTPTFNINGGLIYNAGVRGNTQFHPDGGGLSFLSGAGMGFWADEVVANNEYSMGIYPAFWYGPTAGVALSNGFALITSSTGIGLHFATRESESNSVKTYYGNTLISTTGPGFNVVFNGNSNPAYVGGMLELPNTFYEATTNVRLSIFTIGLTAAEVTAMNTCFQTYLS